MKDFLMVLGTGLVFGLGLLLAGTISPYFFLLALAGIVAFLIALGRG